MNGRNRQLLTLGLTLGGAAILRRHRAVWHVTVDGQPATSRVLHGGEFVPSAGVLLSSLRSGNRRPDAELRFALGLGLIAFGLRRSLIQGES
jgi:hypothetical protein